MIIFTPFVELPQDFMDHNGMKNLVTLNLSSYIFGYSDVLRPLVIIANELDPSIPYDSVMFDTQYANIITSRDDTFISLMSIVLPTYNEPETLVMVLIQHSPYKDCITENIAKIIQQRYGYNCYIISTIEDLYYIRDDSLFSIPGLMNLNRDLERYAMLTGPVTGEIYHDE